MATGLWHWYAGGFAKIANKEMDVNSDALFVQLHTNAYTPDPAHDYQNDLTNEVAAAGNYSTGGVALTGVTVTVVDDSALTAWVAATAYKVGQIRRPTVANGYIYRCSVAGTSHATTEPVWPTTVGLTIVDQGVTWTCVGVQVVKIDFNDPSWASSTITARYGIVVDTTPGTSATNPLLGYCDFGADITTNNGTFLITIDADGALHAFS